MPYKLITVLNNANSVAAHAEGNSMTDDGHDSHAEGFETAASGAIDR